MNELKVELIDNKWYVIGDNLKVEVDSEEDGHWTIARFNFIGQNIGSILNL